MSSKNEDIRSRTQIIIDEILCGGFAKEELQQIIDVCIKEQESL